MATTKIWAVHSRLDHLVDYVANKDKTANLFFDDLRNILEYSGDEVKTKQKYFVSALNCQPEIAYPAMKQALRLVGVSGFEPEASWPRICVGGKIRCFAAHSDLHSQISLAFLG